MKEIEDNIQDYSPLIRNSGVFEPDWYRARLPQADRDVHDLIAHFLHEGTERQLDPGPLFDTSEYLLRNWQLVPGRDNALLHYLTHGVVEGNKVQGVHDRVLHNDQNKTAPTALTSSPASSLRVAVVIHAFYIDVFEKSILPRLKRFPGDPSFLITTDTEEKYLQIKKFFEREYPDRRVFIRVAPNRGRNFGPLLSVWRHALLQHDLLLHIHTKKSLYTGTEQHEWRDTLLDSLLPTPEGVCGIIRNFSEDETVGLLQPAPGPAVPWWAWTWLTNKHVAQPLLERLSIASPNGYFDYPAGGMFWARVEALRPLLEIPWKSEDFPEESGQMDGTLAHAVERCISLVARSTGYRVDEYDREAGLVRIGYGRRNLDLYERLTQKNLLQAIKDSEAVSFDLFDTLLTRIALTPDTIHFAVADRLAREFPALVPSGYDFVRLRKEAEHRARQKRFETDDVTLNEIYMAFHEISGWSEEVLHFAQKEEVRIDQQVLRPRPIVIEALRFARENGKRTLIVSDTYLTRKELNPVLEQAGILSLVDEIYLSSERLGRKDRGDMWDLLIACEDTKTLLHVGDNEQADIQRTADLKIRHHHVLSGLNMLRLSPMAPFVFDSLASPAVTSSAQAQQCRLAGDVLLGPLVAELFGSPFLTPHTSGSQSASLISPITLIAPETAGRVLLGPLLMAFLAKLVLHPALPKMERIFFLSREGFFLSRLYSHLRKNWLPHLPEAKVFPVSRRVAISAAQSVAFDPDILIHSGDGYHGTMAALLEARLNVVLPPGDPLHDMAIRLPDDRATVRAMTLLLKDTILAQAELSRNGLQAWAASQGIRADSVMRYGVVDIGYGGTIQRHLQTALGLPLCGFYMAAEPGAQRVEEAGGLAFGLLAAGEKAVAFRHAYSIFLEAIFTAPHGQVIGYETTREPPVPLFASPGLSQENFDTLTRLVDGAEHYLTDLLESYGTEILPALLHGDTAALASLRAMKEGAITLSPEIAQVLFTEDTFCGRGEVRAVP